MSGGDTGGTTSTISTIRSLITVTFDFIKSCFSQNILVTAADSYGIHKGESNEVKTTAPKLWKPSSESAIICCDQCGNGSSTKPYSRTGHFDKHRNPIYESVLDHIYTNITDVGGINRSPSDFHMSQTFTGGTRSSRASVDDNSSVFEVSNKISRYAVGCKKNKLEVSKQTSACAASCGDQDDATSPTDVGGINWLLSDPYTNQTFIGGVDSSGIDHGSTGILDNPNELEAPKRVGKSAADVDKCYNWSSIFLITMTGQCYHSEYSEQVSNETGEGQSNRNLDSQDSDEHQDVADSEDDFFTSRIAVDFCWVIGCFISLLCLVKTYSWACKEQKRKSRPVICVPMHTLAARTEATSMCCWKGRRQSCAVARFRKAFRKWRWDSVLVWHQRSSMILGGIFLFVLMFQPVVEGSALASQAASVSRTADQRPNLDLGQLAQLDIDPVLLQFIGNVVTDLKEVKTELHVVKNDNMALKHMTQVLETKNLALQNRTQILEVENKVVRAELKQVKLDKAAFENKIRVIQGQNVALHAELSKALIVVAELQNRTRTNSVRLDQCEADAHPFIKEMQASQRRRLQEEETLCRGSGLTAMFEACCPSGSLTGNGHRILQLSEGCDALPQTCSASCAPLFIEYFEGCQGIIDDLAPDQREMFVGFYGGCQEVEQATVAMLEDARPAMIFHVVVMNEVAAQQAQMFGGGNAPAPPVGPIGPLPPSPSPAGGAEIAQEFRRVCTTANLTVCVPQCNRLTYGFLLSIEIDGRGTVMTCNVIDLLYAWVGQASLGGIHRRCVCSVLFVGSVWSGRDIHGDDHGKPRRAH